MSDLISRADAICEVLVNDGIDNIVDRINALPSAEPKLIRVEYSPFRIEETSTPSQTSFRGTQEVHYYEVPSADAVPQLRQTDTLIIADALRYLAKDTERHLVDRTRADALRQQFLKYGASMCKGGAE